MIGEKVLLTLRCPACGHLPLMLMHPEQAFCGNPGCPTATYNPTVTAAAQLATPRLIDVPDFGPPEPAWPAPQPDSAAERARERQCRALFHGWGYRCADGCADCTVLALSEEYIERHGWAVQAVTPTDEDVLGGYAHTVGLTRSGRPELLVSGLPAALAGEVLNAAAADHRQQALDAGGTWTGGSSTVFRVIAAPQADLGGVARRLYGDRAHAVQLVWPDAAGVYPGTSRWVADVQPLFGPPWWNRSGRAR